MFSFKLPVACLGLTITTLTILGAVLPKVEASPTLNQATQTANNWLLQGIEKASQQDYQGAILDFTQAINYHHQDAQAYYQRGLIYAQYAQGKPLNPDGTLPGCKRIDDYKIICPVEVTDKIKEYKQKAIADFTQAITINHEYAAAYYQRGLIEESDIKKLADFQSAREIYFQQTLVSLHQHNYQQAADCLATIEEIYAKRKVIIAPIDNKSQEQVDNPTNSSTASPDRQKSPESLMNEAHQAVRKGDLKTALNIYKRAALILKEKRDSRYQGVQRIIAELAQIADK